MPYLDFDLAADGSADAVITEKLRYACSPAAPGRSAGGSTMGTFAQQTLDGQGQPDETRYLHGDLIRSTNLTTDGAGAPAQTVAYTAFGEVLGAAGPGSDPPAGFPRYQYAGGWGYEADLLTLSGSPLSALAPIRLMHVGARWYQADIGRFVMRDPIGLGGGLNVYVYGLNDPIVLADPEGLYSWAEFFLDITGGRDSWLDNPTTVKKVQKTFNVIALVCAGAASPLPVAAGIPILLAGGTLNVWY